MGFKCTAGLPFYLFYSWDKASVGVQRRAGLNTAIITEGKRSSSGAKLSRITRFDRRFDLQRKEGKKTQNTAPTHQRSRVLALSCAKAFDGNQRHLRCRRKELQTRQRRQLVMRTSLLSPASAQRGPCRAAVPNPFFLRY